MSSQPRAFKSKQPPSSPQSPATLYTSTTLSLESLTQLLQQSSSIDDAPVVTYVSQLLFDAIKKGVSDIHFEPYEHYYRVRWRIDSILYEAPSPSQQLSQKLTARLKIMAQLDIAEQRIPQDGRIQITTAENLYIDCRVSTLPTMWGEKIVLRMLQHHSETFTLETIGLTETQRLHYQRALTQPQGLILVTGPTGSGKTTTLYAGITQLNQPGVNIVTIEDPVEIVLAGVNQVQISDKQGLTFARASRALLRQDPDIMMVGEMRDRETADSTIKAAQTGHLVLSTLHTNDVPQTLTRLLHMGIEPYHIASSLKLLMAQRLLRRLCPHCKTPDTRWSPEQLQALGMPIDPQHKVTLFQPGNCSHCDQQGYRGRIGVHQVVPVTHELSELIVQRASTQAIRHHCNSSGYEDIRNAAMKMAAQGITSIDEVIRVTEAP